jgi:hypothetical protein
LRLDDAKHRHPSYHSHGQGKAQGSHGEGEAQTESGRQHGVSDKGPSQHRHGSEEKKHEAGESGEARKKKDQQHRRDDVFDKHGSTTSQGEKEALKVNPEIKNRQVKDPRQVEPSAIAAKKSEHQKREEKFDAQTVPNSVFGQDRVTLSPEVQMTPAITRKSEAVGVKRGRQKYLPPGLNSMAAKANPAPQFQEFLSAFVKNFT